MFFPHNAKAALKIYELHKMLPETYPEFYRVFMTLGASPGQALDFTDVQDRTATAATTAARILYQMSDYGIVSVEMSPRDRRRKRASMTQKGKRLLGEIMRQFLETAIETTRVYHNGNTQAQGPLVD